MVCLEPIEAKHPVFFIHGQKSLRGKVVAVGPGKRLKRYVDTPHPANFLGDTVRKGTFRAAVGDEYGVTMPTELVPGDVVEYSPYGWDERIIEGKKYVFISEASVLAVTDDSSLEGFQEHTSPELP